MSNIIRLCHPFNFRLLFEFDGRKFTGLFGSFANDLINSITRASNISLLIRSENDQVGERIGESDIYSGCIGLLQRNQSDLMMYFADYPHPASNISQGLLTMDSVIEIITIYRPGSHRVNLAQVEYSFDSFQPEVWFLCLMTMICSVSVLVMKQLLSNWMRRMLNMKRSPRSSFIRVLTDVIAHMTNFGKLSMTGGAIRKITFLILSCFSFVVILYLCLSIKTELVVIAPPKTLRSYQQLIDNDCGVYFFAGSDHYLSFKSAPKGSREKRLWDMSVSKYPMNVVLFAYGQNINPATIIADAMLSGKLALITSSDLSAFSMRSFCSVMLNWEKAKGYKEALNITSRLDRYLPLASRDEGANVYRKGLILNLLTSRPLRRLKNIMRRADETGIFSLMKNYLNDLDPTSLEQKFDTSNDTFGNMEKCISSDIFMPDATHESLKIGNWANFPRYALFLFAFQLTILLIEVGTHRITRSKRIASYPSGVNLRSHRG